jgi:AAA family ATP:ADP antiporter
MSTRREFLTQTAAASVVTAASVQVAHLIDLVMYRGSGTLYGWVFDSLQVLGLKLGAIALCALPVVAGWLVLSAALGRAQERRAAQLGAAAQGD